MTASTTAPYSFLNVAWDDQQPVDQVDTAAEVVQKFLNDSDQNFASLGPEELQKLIDYISQVLAGKVDGVTLQSVEREKLDNMLANLVAVYAQWNTEAYAFNTETHLDAIHKFYTVQMLAAMPAGTLTPNLINDVNANRDFVEHAYNASRFLDKGTPILDPANIQASIQQARDFVQHVTELERLNPDYANSYGLSALKTRFAALVEKYDQGMVTIKNMPNANAADADAINKAKLALVNQFVKDAAVIYRDCFEATGLSNDHSAIERELSVRQSANVLQANDMAKNWNITDVERPTGYTVDALTRYREDYLKPLKAQLEAAGNPLAAGHVQALIDLVSAEISSLKGPEGGVPMPASLRMLKFAAAMASIDIATTRGLISQARSASNEALMRTYENQLAALTNLVKTLTEMMKKVEDNYEPGLSQIGR